MDDGWLRVARLLSNIGPHTFALTRRQKVFCGVAGVGLVAAVSASAIGVEYSPNSVAASLGGPFTVSADSSVAELRNDRRHWIGGGGGFANPWPSFKDVPFAVPFAKLMLFGDKKPKVPIAADRVRAQHINWDRIRKDANYDKMHLTWLSHAAFLLSVPGANILLDPCLSDRCSPLSWAGPSRIVNPPCKLEELDVDVCVISHNHYDHLDLDVMKKLVEKKKDILFFVPMGNKKLLVDAGISNVIECDWWDSYKLHKPASQDSPVESNVQITCTPSQHFSSRTLWDKNKTLWSSWHIQSTVNQDDNEDDDNTNILAEANLNEPISSTPATSNPNTITKKFFFGGDTGYRTVLQGDSEDDVATCPAFREIHSHFGDTDLAALPIGAYAPRHLLSNVHCSPRDAIDIHHDLNAKKSVAMHWGTFVLSREDVMEPPRLLRQEMEKRGMREEEFVVVDIGETVTV
ncbi:hypothetical protein HDU79_003753 [Rhizoclosmatium sp. JEL0117]|nr:hypothetical protein HDU79_003753 [Rhizoclosmatium sp. JEL0117]